MFSFSRVPQLTKMSNVVRCDVARQKQGATEVRQMDFAVVELEAFVLAQFDGGLPHGLNSSAVEDFDEKGRHCGH